MLFPIVQSEIKTGKDYQCMNNNLFNDSEKRTIQ